MLKTLALFTAALSLAACAASVPTSPAYYSRSVPPAAAQESAAPKPEAPAPEAMPVEAAPAAVPATDGIGYDIPDGWHEAASEGGDIIVSLKRSGDASQMFIVRTRASSAKSALSNVALADCNGEGYTDERDGGVFATIDCEDGSAASAFAVELGGVVYLVLGNWPEQTPGDITAEVEFDRFAASLRAAN